MNLNIINYKNFLFYIIGLSIILKIIYISICAYFEVAYFVGPDAWGIFIHSMEVYNYTILNRGPPTRAITQHDLIYIFLTFIGFLNVITFGHYISAALISVFIWFLSFLLLYKSMVLLRIDRILIITATSFYCFLPSIFIFTSTTLREVWQLFFINLMLFIFLKLNTKISFILKLILWFLLLLSWICLFLLHEALFFAGFLFIFFIIFLKILPVLKFFLFNPFYFIITLLFAYIFSYYFYLLLVNSSLSLYYLKNDIPMAISQYQNDLITSLYIWDQSDPSFPLLLENKIPRSTYGKLVDIQNFFDLLIFIPIAFIKYLFEPLFSLNKIVIKDFIVLSENILRFIFITIILVNLLKFKFNIFLLFIIYLLIECLWSLGTVNWGTSMRHHVPTWGMLILCVFYALNNILKKKIKP